MIRRWYMEIRQLTDPQKAPFSGGKRGYTLVLDLQTTDSSYGFDRHAAVHQADAGVRCVAVHASVGQRGVLVAAEFKDGVVHLGAVEDADTLQQVEVVDGQACNSFEERRFQLADDVFEALWLIICRKSSTNGIILLFCIVMLSAIR